MAGNDVGWYPTQFEEEVSSKIRYKDTKIFWDMQIFGHKKLSFLTKNAHFLAYLNNL